MNGTEMNDTDMNNGEMCLHYGESSQPYPRDVNDDHKRPLLAPPHPDEEMDDTSEDGGESMKKRRGVMRQGAHAVTFITIKDLAPHFELPLREAALAMGMCSTMLKKVCRNLGLGRWPYRQIKKHKTRLTRLAKVNEERRLRTLRKQQTGEIDNKTRRPQINYTPTTNFRRRTQAKIEHSLRALKFLCEEGAYPDGYDSSDDASDDTEFKNTGNAFLCKSESDESSRRASPVQSLMTHGSGTNDADNGGQQPPCRVSPKLSQGEVEYAGMFGESYVNCEHVVAKACLYPDPAENLKGLHIPPFRGGGAVKGKPERKQEPRGKDTWSASAENLKGLQIPPFRGGGAVKGKPGRKREPLEKHYVSDVDMERERDQTERKDAFFYSIFLDEGPTHSVPMQGVDLQAIFENF